MAITANEIINRRKELWLSHKDIEQDRKFTDAVAKKLTEKSEDGDALRAEVKDQPRLLIEMTFVVVDKEMNTIPFFLNNVQLDFSNTLYEAERDFKEGNTYNLRFLVLKGRQQGFTSYITAEQLARSIVRRNYSGFTVADNAENTATIFEDKAKFPYSHLPVALQPTEKYNNRKELHFDKINSRWRIATASKDIGRSKTVYFLHISEAAFLDVPISSIQAAIGEALTKDAIQIYESTANGYNEFKDAWDSKKFRNCFYVWYKTKEYALDFESEVRENWFKQQVNNSNDWIFTRCKWLIEKIGVSWQQVYWYYTKFESYIDGDTIKQEYPCSADEAFLASGRCVFDQEKIIYRKEELALLYKEKPPTKGWFEFNWKQPEYKDRIIIEGEKKPKFLTHQSGYITIYEKPIKGHPYVIGGDTKGEGSDFFAATVIDNSTGKRVATLHARIDPDTYAHQMYCLGHYYNKALIAIEINFDLYPVKELKRLQYPKQCTREVVDSKSLKKEEKLGFKTDGNTRPMIISNEIVLIRDNPELFTDLDFLSECLTFVYDDRGRPDAESGKHDDILFSDMIAEHARRQQSFKAIVPKEELTGFWTPGELKDHGYKTLEIVKMRH